MSASVIATHIIAAALPRCEKIFIVDRLASAAEHRLRAGSGQIRRNMIRL
jgi:hypothetical protein